MSSRHAFLVVAATAVLLNAPAGSQPRPVNPGIAKDKRAVEADPASIAKLVAALGSPKFAEREQAKRELEALGVPALAALRKAAADPDSEVAGRARSLIDTIESSLAGLLAAYRDYGLPLPPDDARLVRFESGGRYVLNGKLMPPTYFLGFLLPPSAGDKQPVLLVGTRQVLDAARRTIEPVDAKPELVDGLDLGYWPSAPFESNTGLAVALQCKARGWDALADRLWAASLKHTSGHPRGAYYQPADVPNRTALSYLAWVYSANELVTPDTDRAKTVGRMKAVLTAEPRLDTNHARELVRAAEASLAPSKAKPGTAERLVDDLTDMCNTGRGSGEKDPRFTRLAVLGFDAVPALLEHLDDRRLTRSVRTGFNNFPTQHMQVRHVVSDLLQELAGDDVGTDWLRRQRGEVVDRSDVQAWWETARKEGEEAYFVRRVLPTGDQKSWPNSLMLDVLSRKYPQRLPELYRTILADRPKIQSWPIAKAIGGSSLSDEKKRAIFLEAARTKDLLHRRSALDHLRPLDHDQFVTILLATLEALPRTPTSPYWSCPEAAYAHVVLTTDDARVWKAFEAVAKRSDVGLRMEFMNPMNYTHLGDRQRAQRLAFLAAFLEDAEAPDVAANPKMFEGPHAGFTFSRLEVRDLAAMKIASLLDMPDHPDRNWTVDQWKDLRKRVRERLKK
jgi:hypothetical protein